VVFLESSAADINIVMIHFLDLRSPGSNERIVMNEVAGQASI
jgi:hypothetical protein